MVEIGASWHPRFLTCRVVVHAIGLDHIVLNTTDVERSLAWYEEHLGLESLRVDEWRRGKVLFPSLRIDATTLIDLFPAERGGENLNHFAVVVAPGTDLAALASSGEFEVVGGPASLFGAQGQGEGLYVRDPDGNVVELRTYPGRAAEPS
jgi:catechol 2,3-dioxygenase-like lactoylglutathione lyase family enzyme